ncbi:flavin reductase family protein [Amphibacillus sp. MSJ-3]|uniref:flavin reductase family protein n=1 Tax=Amphibacillus sp. MSJ-3 TaxID=2841505 RepID=UPI001C0F01F5|nr:flavin reductase family protein [Amphibacillus sp. MSJ-3]MBU5594174.1 flavin reductase family protein [Amphibacillus sp. MSJ-3]
MTDSKRFRQAMGQFATGITVVSAWSKVNNDVKGMTVNAFMSLSLDPLLIAISLRNQAAFVDVLTETNQFGISVLADHQKDLSMIFSNQKQAEQPVDFDYLDQTPVIPNALVQIVCEKESEVVAGDHTIYIAKVKHLKTSEGDPLIFYGGQYRKLD